MNNNYPTADKVKVQADTFHCSSCFTILASKRVNLIVWTLKGDKHSSVDTIASLCSKCSEWITTLDKYKLLNEKAYPNVILKATDNIPFGKIKNYSFRRNEVKNKEQSLVYYGENQEIPIKKYQPHLTNGSPREKNKRQQPDKFNRIRKI